MCYNIAMNAKDILDRYAPEIDAALRASLPAADERLNGFYGMMRYALGWADENLQPTRADAGKRWRPVLCLLACAAAGDGNYHRALPAVAALELLHNFSLIHDDIEDGSLERRHRPTVWQLWGIPQGVNTGDGLLMLAHQALARLADAGVEAATVVAVTQVLDQACLELCQGQFLDLSYEGRLDVSVDDYLAMIGGKSAALIAAATQIGAMLALATPAIVEHYRRCGQRLGLAFQIADDVLGIWGDPAVTGKPAADDLARRKKSLPVVYALGQPGGPWLAALYRQEVLSPADVARALALLDEAGARAYAQGMAERYRDEALAELAATGLQNAAQEQLLTMAHFAVERAY
jgi:geranylgeranyl diphosphate synthase type I